MMQKKIFSSIITILSLFLVWNIISSPNEVSAFTTKWQKIYEGIDYIERDYGKWFKKGKLYAFKLSKKRSLKFLIGEKKPTSLQELEKKHNSLVIINGSYFDENYAPVGMLKINNKLVNPKNEVGSSGILAVKDNEVAIFHKKDTNLYKDYPNIMQNGPLLVENNGKSGIYSDDKEYSARTAIGMTKDNKTILIVADRTASPSLWEFAKLLSTSESQGGFECKTAINLDGGSSTGLRVNTPSKKLIVEENDFIHNAVGVF